MKFLAPIFIAILLCGCTAPEHVSPAEFKKQYEYVGQAQTMREVVYLGQRNGKAFARIKSMSPIRKKWSEQIIYVELKELDPVFREALPNTKVNQ